MGFEASIFLEAVTSPALARGAAISVALALLSMLFAFLVAVPLAALTLSGGRILRGFIAAYVWLFRGTPALLVLLFIWNGLPQLSPIFRGDWFTPFMAAFLALALIGVAYLTEILRGAYLAVPEGQRQAAIALGMRRWQVLLLVELPQAIRVATPSLINELISTLKTTSLAMAISLREMMTITTFAISSTFRFLEWYGAALVWYLALISVVMVLQNWVERRMGRAYAAAPQARSGA